MIYHCKNKPWVPYKAHVVTYKAFKLYIVPMKMLTPENTDVSVCIVSYKMYHDMYRISKVMLLHPW